MLIAVRAAAIVDKNHRRHDTSHNTHKDFRTVCTLCTLQSHPPPSRRPVAVPRQPFAIPVADYPVCGYRHTHMAHIDSVYEIHLVP